MSAPIDSWGSPTPSPARPSYASKARVVKDSWDDSSDDEQPQSNQQIWENANKQDRMPEIISASRASAPPPPAAALTGPMRILKRPTPATTPESSRPGSQQDVARKRLDEREAEYQAARERIFGKDSSSAPSTPKPDSRRPGAKSPTPAATVTTVSRQPKGPQAGIDGAGFTKPRTRAPPRKDNATPTLPPPGNEGPEPSKQVQDATSSNVSDINAQ